YSEEATAQYGQYYNLPLPRNDASMPEGQPNVPEMIENSGKGGTFTITDQAFPTEVADVLFAAQDAIYGGTMTPEQAAEDVQAAIEAYLAK
ncbi:MAG: carbohydrate ABC transporter substrate-binding protein, partial [Lachnospiraceae bacterium]|nr:carbohydrate ABC transporter substrate-binding protein [Lachnospiraceae bacterium]